MDIEWRTVQMFLDVDGVFEVEIDQDTHKKVRCSCTHFSRAARCKHTRYVKEAMENNDGHYAIQIPVDIDDEEAWTAMSSSEAFRDFIIKYGKVVVLE